MITTEYLQLYSYNSGIFGKKNTIPPPQGEGLPSSKLSFLWNCFTILNDEELARIRNHNMQQNSTDKA